MAIQPQAPTGDTIASEVEREMQDRLYRLRNVVLAPAEYYVYLHPDDFVQIELIVPRLALDIQMCLNALVEKLNNRSRWSRLIEGKRAPIEIPPGGWSIYIRPAVNDEVAPGEIGIHSRLSVPAARRFGSGAGTTRIAQTVVSAGERRTTVKNEPTAALTGTDPEEAAPASAPLGRQSHSSGPRLSYSDDSGPHVFFVVKDLIKIGRGGLAHWVDLAIVSRPEVSREHCRLRRDPTGKFYVQDVSSWGTFINGTRLTKYVDSDRAAVSAEGEVKDGDAIRLADAVTLEFRVP